MAKPSQKPAVPKPRGETSGDWYVFETFAADGSFAIGIREGVHDPLEVMLVQDRLSRDEAIRIAKRHAADYRREGGTMPEFIGV